LASFRETLQERLNLLILLMALRVAKLLARFVVYVVALSSAVGPVENRWPKAAKGHKATLAGDQTTSDSPPERTSTTAVAMSASGHQRKSALLDYFVGASQQGRGYSESNGSGGL
jgi:hypothetical protein